jgi:hypothetical protein
VVTNDIITQGGDKSGNGCGNDGSGYMKMKFQPNLNVARSYDNCNSNNNVSNTNINNNSNNILADIEKNFKANDPSSSSHQTQRKSSIHHHHDKKEQITYQFTQDTFKHPKRPSSPNNNTNPSTTHNKPSSTPQTLSSIITSLKSTDPTAYTPILLPFTTPPASQQQPSSSPSFQNDSIYLFQFPRQIPLNIPLQSKLKKDETLTDEPQYDSNGYLIQPEYQNIFTQIPNHTPLGKLTLYKSGKHKLTIGNVTFIITEGIKTKFAQQLAIINSITNKAYILGEVINKKLIVIPEFDI